MLFKFITVLSLLSTVFAFNMNRVKPETKFNFVGDTAPLGYFDPFNFIDNKSESFLKYLREAELQHSRVAMTAMVLLPFMDMKLPDNTLAINSLSESPFFDQLAFFLTFGYFESQRVMKNYQNPFENEMSFTLKENVEPGKYINIETTDRLMNVELNNGRLAMIACLGYIAQELVTKEAIF